MNLTIAEFIQTLYAHRMFDANLPSLRLEELYWQQWSFDNSGAHYIEPGLRNDMNVGVMEWKMLTRGDLLTLLSWKAERMHS